MSEFLAVIDHPADKQIELRRISAPRYTNAAVLFVDGNAAPLDDPLPFASKVDWSKFAGWGDVLKTLSTFIDYDPAKTTVTAKSATATLKLASKLDASTLFSAPGDEAMVAYALRPVNASESDSARLDVDGKTILPDMPGDIRVIALYNGEQSAFVTVTIEA